MLPMVLGLAAALALPVTRSGAETKDKGFVGRAPAAMVVGKPISCISTLARAQATVHDDYTIDFKVGRQVYRNALPHRCPGLGFDRAFGYRRPVGQLCSVDMIYVLRNIGGRLQRGALCSLGTFTPVELVKKN